MPVLGEDDVLELAAQPVDERNDLISAIDSECAAGAEVVLEIDNKKYIGGLADFHVSQSGTGVRSGVNGRCRVEADRLAA